MNLLRQLDSVCPRWRETVASDPLEAAASLGLLDDDSSTEYGTLDFHDERANARRLSELDDDED